MSPEIRKFVVHCYFGKFFHIEKIIEMLYKKHDLLITEDELQKFIDDVDNYIRHYKP